MVVIGYRKMEKLKAHQIIILLLLPIIGWFILMLLVDELNDKSINEWNEEMDEYLKELSNNNPTK